MKSGHPVVLLPMSLPDAGPRKMPRRESEGLSYLLVNEPPLPAPWLREVARSCAVSGC